MSATNCAARSCAARAPGPKRSRSLCFARRLTAPGGVAAQVVQPLFMMASRPLLSSVASAGIAGAVRGTPKAARSNIAATKRVQNCQFGRSRNFVLNAAVLLLVAAAGIEAAGKEVPNGSEVVLDAWLVDHQLE